MAKNQTTERTDARFRDPAGQLIRREGRYLRVVNPSHHECVGRILDSPDIKGLMDKGLIVKTWQVPSAQGQREAPRLVGTQSSPSTGELVLEHEAIQPQSTPVEWSPSMLHEAARLTIELSSELIERGMSLKDATPQNIQFKNSSPILVDFLSFEFHDPELPVWPAYSQFIRSFVYPLILSRHLSWPLQRVFASSSHDGISTDLMVATCRGWNRFLGPIFSSVTLPQLLSRFAKARDIDKILNAKRSTDVALHLRKQVLERASRLLRQLQPRPRRSYWSNYYEGHSYNDDAFKTKLAFIDRVMSNNRCRRTLDVGCNTGHFTRTLAKHADHVVAIDADEEAVDRLFKSLQKKPENIQPLVVDITLPTPAMGWRNRETPSFLERTSGQFDLVMGLAVLHHLMIHSGVTLREMMTFLSTLTSNLLLFEFVEVDDPEFESLRHGRDFSFMTVAGFEQEIAGLFEVEAKERMGTKSRWLYLLRKKPK